MKTYKVGEATYEAPLCPNCPKQMLRYQDRMEDDDSCTCYDCRTFGRARLVSGIPREQISAQEARLDAMERRERDEWLHPRTALWEAINEIPATDWAIIVGVTVFLFALVIGSCNLPIGDG